jgi:hypothetical protein
MKHIKMSFIKRYSIILWLAVFSQFSSANTASMPLLVDYIQNDIVPATSASITVEDQSVTGTYNISWELNQTYSTIELEEYQRNGTVDEWQLIYRGSDNYTIITKSQDGEYK